MHDIKRDFLYQAICTDCLVLHSAIITDFNSQLNAPNTRKSHFFNGRYENIYIAADKISGLPILLTHIQTQAAKLLATESDKLKIGFWFNVMQPGDLTLPHAHDDHDEILSGTYYLQMPTGSGKLLIHHSTTTSLIEPNEGLLVLFHPAVQHEVTAHHSDHARISLGFNIGPAC